MSLSNRLSWFALYVAPRSEFKVEDACRESADVDDVYCPTETKWHRERRIRRVVRWPLVPGYLFAGLSPIRHGPNGPEFPFDALRAMEGVLHLIGSSGRPWPLQYDAPSAQAQARFAELARKRWEERCEFFPRDAPAAPQERPLAIGEVRDMEAAGSFDFTQDRLVAERAAKLVRRSFSSFADLAAALSDREAA